MPLLTKFPTDDAYVDQGLPDTNFGTATFLAAGFPSASAVGITRTWMKFNISAIPAGSIIDSAILNNLFYYQTDGYNTLTYNIQRATNTSWGETSVSGTPITWNNAPNGSVLAPVITMDVPTGHFPWPTPDLASFVSAALASGVLVLRIMESTDGVNGGCLFESKDYPAATEYPYLDITYHAPSAGKRRSSVVFV